MIKIDIFLIILIIISNMLYFDALPSELRDLLMYYFNGHHLIQISKTHLLKSTIQNKDEFWSVKLKSDYGIIKCPSIYRTSDCAYKIRTYYEYFVLDDKGRKRLLKHNLPMWYDMENAILLYTFNNYWPELIDLAVELEYTPFILRSKNILTLKYLYENYPQFRDKIVVRTLLFGPKELIPFFNENISISGIIKTLREAGYYELPSSTTLDDFNYCL